MKIRPPSWVYASSCLFLGTFIATLPHLINWWRIGVPLYFADTDEFSLYLMNAAKAYHQHGWRLGDPTSLDHASTVYPWLQLMPGILIAKWLQLPPEYIGMVWRIIAGASVAGAWYWCLRQFQLTRASATIGTIFTMTTGAWFTFRFGYHTFMDLWQWAHLDSGELLPNKPKFLLQWRVISPGLSLWSLLLLVGAAQRHVNGERSRRTAALLAISIGLMFYTYFYYWTAIGLGMAVVLVLDRHRLRVWLLPGIAGFLLGLPSLIGDMITKQSTTPDWLPRSDKFLPIGHFDELVIPKLGFLAGIGCAIYCWRKERNWHWLPVFGLSALVLLNHQIFTGLQIENFHWYFAWCPLLLVSLWVIGDRLMSRYRVIIAIFILGIQLPIAFALRYAETARQQLPDILVTTFQQTTQDIQSTLEPGVIGGEILPAESLVLRDGLTTLTGYSSTLSSHIDNQEWNERIALNGWLLGDSAGEFRTQQQDLLQHQHWGPWPRRPGGLEDLLADRMQFFNHISDSPSEYIAKYKVRYVVLQAGTSPRPLFDVIVQGEKYDLYEISSEF